ncbi:Mediator of RNA polymerase II transcription subunit 20a [Lathyrus oleraceus]|uniref:Mediator of RNA polymerase II transcription subunit 20 n=1 Tax=Pisum sativum TaxID=3888 RepID=A0A9D4XAJ7_PEA|nr:Mediator of RNA polymerase II transcription subunit 20a [Pisum sativum]
MPVRWILHWQPSQGSVVNSHILNEISQCVDTFSGVKEGRWKSTLTFYRPNVRDQSMSAEFPRDFLGISLMEQPDKYYFIIRGHKLVLEADSSILTIMEKLQSYKSKVALNFEGLQYRLGDFQLRLIKVVPNQAENLRGILMEIEYLPISSIEVAKPVLEEFIEIWREVLSKKSLPGQFMRAEPVFAEYGLSDRYTFQHTAVQYAAALAQLIASVQSGQIRMVRRRGADGRIPIRTLDRGASSSAAAAEPTGYPGGPYDTSLLVKYEHHVARHIWFGEERGPKKELKVAGHGLKLNSRVPLALPPQMESWVSRSGLASLQRTSLNKIDTNLVSAFVER